MGEAECMEVNHDDESLVWSTQATSTTAGTRGGRETVGVEEMEDEEHEG